MKPEEYKSLFEKHDVVPVTGTYVCDRRDSTGKCGACAVGIAFFELLGDPETVRVFTNTDGSYNTIIRQLAKDANMSEEFLRGLDDGWEDYGPRPGKTSKEYHDGFYEGQAAAKLIGPTYYTLSPGLLP